MEEMNDAKLDKPENESAQEASAADSDKKKIISMAMKVDSATADEFRKMSRQTGMEQGMFLKAMIENFRLNEDKTLYKEHAEDIQLMRDLTATINYKYVALIAQNKIAEEKAHARDVKKIDELEREKKEFLEEKKFWDVTRERNANLEHEVNELKEMLHKLENKIEQMAAMHKNEIDALTNKHNAAMTEMAQSYADKYMKFVEENSKTTSDR